MTPNVRSSIRAGVDAATAVVLPHDHDGSPLPVLLDPYAGPHAQRVVQSHNAYLSSQWFADQGFAVVIIDGRGTPGRGSEHERAVHGDLASLVLEDQIDGLYQAADELGFLDLDRVGIRGWSFGGYLAALAVLRRPDVFHAAVAGAPATEWRLYDTHYTERYLGDPTDDTEAYDDSSLLPLADQLTRPLLLIHGLADDNVVAAHTLQLSSALLAAGKPHEVLAARRYDPHDERGGRGREPAAAPAGVPPAVARSGSCARGGFHMNERLSRLYHGVAVHATADLEHMAALELLVLVMLADHHVDQEEVDTIRSISEDWRGGSVLVRAVPRAGRGSGASRRSSTTG